MFSIRLNSLCRLGKQICVDRKKDVSGLVCKMSPENSIFYTRDQADDECFKTLNKNQTVQMSQHVSALENVAYKRKGLFSFFVLRKKQM